MRPNSVNGVTLIELLMAMTLMGILTGLVAPIISQGLGASNQTQQNLQSLDKTRWVMERLAREIRHIDHNGANYLITSMNAANLVFTKNDDEATQVSVSVAGTQLSLAYANPSLMATATLSDEVAAFALIYLDINGAVTVSNANVAFVEINVSMQNPMTGALFSQRTRVALRNRA